MSTKSHTRPCCMDRSSPREPAPEPLQFTDALLQMRLTQAGDGCGRGAAAGGPFPAVAPRVSRGRVRPPRPLPHNPRQPGLVLHRPLPAPCCGAPPEAAPRPPLLFPRAHPGAGNFLLPPGLSLMPTAPDSRASRASQARSTLCPAAAARGRAGGVPWGGGKRRGRPPRRASPLAEPPCHSPSPGQQGPPPPPAAPRAAPLGPGRERGRAERSRAGRTAPGPAASAAPSLPPGHGRRAAWRGSSRRRTGVRLGVGLRLRVRFLPVALPAGAARDLRRVPPPLPRPAQPAAGHSHPQVLVRRPGLRPGGGWGLLWG